MARGVYDVLPNHEWDDPYDSARKRAAWTGLLAVPSGIAAGLTALAIHGVWGLPTDLMPEVGAILPNRPRAREGVRIRYIAECETVTINGREVAAPIPALVQALPELERNNAVAILDSACNRKLIKYDDLYEIRERLRGRRGSRKVYPWFPLVEPKAQSPFETYARLQCRDAGIPPPTLQVQIHDEVKGTYAYGDLGWQRRDGLWILIDLDGRRYHEDPRSLVADRRRQNSIALTGRYIHLRFAWEDLRTGAIPKTVQKALANNYWPPY